MKKLDLLKFYFSILLSFFGTFEATAQVGFNNESIIKNIWEGDIKQMLSSDINGDEIDDIIFASGFGTSHGHIGWFENISDFEFSDYYTIVGDSESFIKDFHVGDLDGDGDQDIVYSTASEIFWLNNLDGLGSFSDPILIYEDMNIPLLELADVDIDGDLDIVAVVFYSGDFWFENTSGLGDFSAHEWETSVIIPYALHVYDVDGDGDNDVLYYGDEGWLGWVEDIDGSGNFDVKHEIKSFSVLASLYPTDFDGDGDDDILIVDGNLGLNWFENIEDGNFGPQIEIEQLNGGYPQFLDVNGDSQIDVVTKNAQEIYFTVDVGGQLFETTNIPLNLQNPVVVGSLAFTYGDYDADGDFDFCQFQNYATLEHTLVLENRNDTSFEEITKLEYFDQEFKSIEIGDIDGDTDLDFIIEDSKNEKISWYENRGGVSTSWEEHVVSDTIWSTGAIPGSNLVLSDIDGDSDLDIVKNHLDESLYWLENSDGNYGAPLHFIEIQDEVVNLNSVDMDSDGDMDIVAGFEEYILVYVNQDGLGSFSEGIEIHRGDRIGDVFTFDVDGDGLIDVMHEILFEGTYWQKNLGGGSFSDTLQISGSTIGVLVRDVDNDGDMDIINKGIYGSGLEWFENDDLGNFTINTSIVSSSNTLIVLLTSDIDSDGDMDIVVHDPNSFDFGWLENLGQSSGFSDYKFLITNDVKNFNPKITKMNLDVDHDGDEDFILAREGQVDLYENRSDANFINGVVKFGNDINACDASNYTLKNIFIETSSEFETLTTKTNESGNYILAPIEGEYTTSIIQANENFESNPEMYVYEFLDLGEVVVNDFCITPLSPVNDLEIDIYTLGPPRPGFEFEYRIIYTNKGTTLMNGQVVFEYDETIISFEESNTTIESQSSNSLTFSFSELFPLESREINLRFKVGLIPDVMLGDQLIANASVFPIADDIHPEDNVQENIRTIVGAYDPNDIQVMEGSQILVSEAENYLHYVIRFQNTGNFPAENIRVTNVLDDHLDYKKMVLGASSHPYTMMITDGKDIEFKFDNINLPDSVNNEPESHGFITYKIKPKSNFSLGDIVYNDAEIFFDFNPPIQTNIVSTEVVNNLSSKDVLGSRVNIFPNPVGDSGNIVIETKERITKIEITDIFGNTTIVEGDDQNIDFSKFGSGIYFLLIHVENENRVVKKVIKI